MISIDEDALSDAFGVNINQSDIENMTKGYMTEISGAITGDYTAAQTTFVNNLSTITKNILNDYIAENSVGGVAFLKLSEVQSVVNQGLARENNKAILASMEAAYVIPQDTFSQMYNGIITAFLQQYVSMMGTSSGIPGGGATPGLGNVTIPPVGNMINQNSITESAIAGLGNTLTENTTISNTATTNTTNPGSTPSIPSAGEDKSAPLASSGVDTMVDAFVSQDAILQTSKEIAVAMTEATMQKTILTKVGELTGKLMESLASAFNVEPEKIASAFKFDMDEEEIKRLFTAMSSTSVENAKTKCLGSPNP